MAPWSAIEPFAAEIFRRGFNRPPFFPEQTHGANALVPVCVCGDRLMRPYTVARQCQPHSVARCVLIRFQNGHSVVEIRCLLTVLVTWITFGLAPPYGYPLVEPNKSPHYSFGIGGDPRRRHC